MTAAQIGDLTVDAGELVVVFGPPRSGKTALLTALAESRPTADVLMINADGTLLPQSKFAAAAAKVQLRRRRDAAARAAARERSVDNALARALAKNPRMLLIDVPSAPARPDTVMALLAARLTARLSGFAAGVIVATDNAHLALDLAGLTSAGRISVVEDGAIVQTGAPSEVAARPRSKYAARLTGVNFFTGLGRGGRLSIGHSSISAPTRLKGRVLITLPPTAVTVAADEPADAGPDVFEARIAHLSAPGAAYADTADAVDDVLNLGLSPVDPERGLELTATVPQQFASPWTLGQRVFARVDTEQLTAYDF